MNTRVLEGRQTLKYEKSFKYFYKNYALPPSQLGAGVL